MARFVVHGKTYSIHSLNNLSIPYFQEKWLELSLDLASYRQLVQLQIDAFTSAAFAGNPAAVVLLPASAGPRYSEQWMQQLAAENNLAETAFIAPLSTASRNDYSIRWSLSS